MVETYVGPSELHLKKELGALCKARFLRDPETCSSWRSRASSRSLTATYSLERGNAPGEKLNRTDNSQKKVYLYNWRYHSSKSSDRGLKLNDNSRQDSVDESLDDRSSILSKVDSKSDTYLDVYASTHGVRDKQQENTVTRGGRKSQRSGSSRKQKIRNSAVTKFLDGSSSSLGILNQVEESDDSDHGIGKSEDLRQPAHEYTQGTGHPVLSASPLLSLSALKNQSCSSRFFRNAAREESSHSYTPVSTSSYNRRYGVRNASTVGSWDGATSLDEDELDQMDLRGQGCGIPCYWPRRSKDMGCGGWYSPSLSDTLRRKGNSILCRGQKFYNRGRLSASQKQKYLLKTSRGLSHLTSSCGGGSSSSEAATDDELSSNFGELDLEALSRLDGRRWSSCKSQDGWELALPGATNLEILHRRNLNQKHQPMSFDEIMGQNIVVQSLSNAVSRGRIAPAYLFYGPRGTGKTATAMVFSAALKCLSTVHKKKPCGFCKECRNFSSGNGSNLIEVDATDNKSMDRFTYLLKNMSVARKSSRHKVFVIDECHMLSSKLWSAFMKFLEEPLPRVVFIFVTIDPDKLPHAILSRCQKYLFPKIKDADIVCRLRKISEEEKLDVELDALNVIALNSDGSLRDAETMLDQLTLLGKRITTSLVNDLLGIVSEEKLLDLLEIAMSSDTAETVKRSRELMDSGVDPMALMNQLAALIMDIIAGTYQLANSECGGTVLGGRSLTEGELERLQQALKILSDAEKQLKVSSERSTWFTAALLQLGSGHDAQQTPAISHEPNTLLMRITSRSPNPHGHRSESLPSELLHSKDQPTDHEVSKNLAEIWKRCIERCHSKKLREMLYDHGKLVSITESEGLLVAFLGFTDDNIKSQVERFSSNIKNSLDMVLRHSVEIRIGLISEYYTKGKSVLMFPARDQLENVKFLLKKKMNQSDELDESSEKDRKHGATEFSRKSTDYSRAIIQRTLQKHEHSSVMNGCINKSDAIHLRNEDGQVHRTPMSTTDEQRLESAWLQTEEKSMPGALSHSKREKNQILPQNGASLSLSSVVPRSSSCREEDLDQQIEALKACNTRLTYNEETSRRVDHSAISPSLLHNNNLAANSEKENTEYDSAPGCEGLFCWNLPKSNRGKLKRGTRLRSRRSTRISLFGKCGKSKTLESASTDQMS